MEDQEITSPHGLNIVVADCEIRNEIKPETGIGWRDYDKQGHAVTGLYDYETGDYRIYMEDNLHELRARLDRATMIVGFNWLGFDANLLDCHLGGPTPRRVYDMLLESRRAVGWDPQSRQRPPSGMKLDDHLLATFGPQGMKSGNGGNAPVLWQQGKLGELCSYVLRDVNREKAVFEHAWFHGEYKTVVHGARFLKKHPQEFYREFAHSLSVIAEPQVDVPVEPASTMAHVPRPEPVLSPPCQGGGADMIVPAGG